MALLAKPWFTAIASQRIMTAKIGWPGQPVDVSPVRCKYLADTSSGPSSIIQLASLVRALAHNSAHREPLSASPLAISTTPPCPPSPPSEHQPHPKVSVGLIPDRATGGAHTALRIALIPRCLYGSASSLEPPSASFLRQPPVPGRRPVTATCRHGLPL